MKHITKTVVVAVSVIAMSFGVYAETSDAKQADIRKLMKVTGAANLGEQMMTQMLPMLKQNSTGIPDEFWTEFMSEIDMSKLVELCIPSYEKYFTHDEIKGLLKFYETPLGKKMIQVQPQIMLECMIAGQQWGQQIGAKAAQKIQDYKKAGSQEVRRQTETGQ